MSSRPTHSAQVHLLRVCALNADEAREALAFRTAMLLDFKSLSWHCHPHGGESPVVEIGDTELL